MVAMKYSDKDLNECVKMCRYLGEVKIIEKILTYQKYQKEYLKRGFFKFYDMSDKEKKKTIYRYKIIESQFPQIMKKIKRQYILKKEMDRIMRKWLKK